MWGTERVKEFDQQVKLNDKNMKLLQESQIDNSMGMATPSSCANAEVDPATVKAEIPSLEPLKELQKTLKISQLCNCCLLIGFDVML